MTEVVSLFGLALRLVLLLLEMARDRKQQGIGYAEAIRQTLDAAHKELAIGDAERIAADQAHRDPTDDAFDRTFERPSP